MTDLRCDEVWEDDYQDCPQCGGYPANIENPDDWAAFLARYLDNRATNAVHNWIGLVALHIADAIRDARSKAANRITALTARLAELERATPEEVVEMAARALRDTPLLVPGTLFDLLCTTTYANDHIIALLLNDAAANAVAAIAPALRRQGAAVEKENNMPDLRKIELTGIEEWREYDFGGRVYRIDAPASVEFYPGSTTHRVTDASGIVHCVPAPGNGGCVLRWKGRVVA